MGSDEGTTWNLEVTIFKLSGDEIDYQKGSRKKGLIQDFVPK